jgi:hypothetical protein
MVGGGREGGKENKKEFILDTADSFIISREKYTYSLKYSLLPDLIL